PDRQRPEEHRGRTAGDGALVRSRPTGHAAARLEQGLARTRRRLIPRPQHGLRYGGAVLHCPVGVLLCIYTSRRDRNRTKEIAMSTLNLDTLAADHRETAAKALRARQRLVAGTGRLGNVDTATHHAAWLGAVAEKFETGETWFSGEDIRLTEIAMNDEARRSIDHAARQEYIDARDGVVIAAYR